MPGEWQYSSYNWYTGRTNVKLMMKIKKIITIILLLILIGCLPLLGDYRDEESNLTPSISSADAIEMAKKYIGFEQLRNYSDKNILEPRLIRFAEEQDSTPFFHDKIVNRDIWLVRFQNVGITYERCNKVGNPPSNIYYRDFNVYIDPQTGALLKIAADVIRNEWAYLPGGSAKSKEDHMRKAGSIYVMPDIQPVPLITVLSKCRASACYAAEIEAIFASIIYVEDREPRTRWIVTLRGIPPVDFFGQGAENIPEDRRSSADVYADPATGETTGKTVPAL